jgi:hypothetical protein
MLIPANVPSFALRHLSSLIRALVLVVGNPVTTIWSPGHRPLRAGPSDPGNSWVGGRHVARLEIGVQLPDRGEHVAERDGTVVPGAIDVEGRSAADAAVETTLLIFFDATSVLMTGQLSAYAVRVQE